MHELVFSFKVKAPDAPSIGPKPSKKPKSSSFVNSADVAAPTREELARDHFIAVSRHVAKHMPCLLPILQSPRPCYHTWSETASVSAISSAQQALVSYVGTCDLFSLTVVAEAFGVDPKTIRNWIRLSNPAAQPHTASNGRLEVRCLVRSCTIYCSCSYPLLEQGHLLLYGWACLHPSP
jgi:hypothetical protein